jgi:hypothetical protein
MVRMGTIPANSTVWVYVTPSNSATTILAKGSVPVVSGVDDNTWVSIQLKPNSEITTGSVYWIAIGATVACNIRINPDHVHACGSVFCTSGVYPLILVEDISGVTDLTAGGAGTFVSAGPPSIYIQ